MDDELKTDLIKLSSRVLVVVAIGVLVITVTPDRLKLVYLQGIMVGLFAAVLYQQRTIINKLKKLENGGIRK